MNSTTNEPFLHNRISFRQNAAAAHPLYCTGYIAVPQLDITYFLNSINTFFITGYPRSRSAWLANWLSDDWRICLHDELVNHATLESFADAIQDHPVTGVSDSALALFWKPLMQMFPEAKWLVVMRDRADAEAATIKSLTDDPLPGCGAPEAIHLKDFFDRSQRALVALCEAPNVLTVRFDELDSQIVAENIWRHIVGQGIFPLRRWKMLKALRITQIASKRTVNLPNIRALAATLPHE